MPNPQLSSDQLKRAHGLLKQIRKKISALAEEDARLIFAFRRKIYKELMYDERGKPAVRRRLKVLMYKKQNGKCALCKKPMNQAGSVLDRKQAINEYVEANVRLLCYGCDNAVQARRKYKDV